MKIRSGFVSNSSSSSFVVCGEVIPDLPEIFNSELYAKGYGCCEGEDFFPLTKTMFNYLKKNEEVKDKFEYYLVKELVGESSDVKTHELPSGCNIYVVNADHSPTSDLNELKEKYGAR